MRDDADFSTGDLEIVSALAGAAWRAGTLEWSCTRTADHAVDTILAPAFFLASRKLDGYPALGGADFSVGADGRRLTSSRGSPRRRGSWSP